MRIFQNIVSTLIVAYFLVGSSFAVSSEVIPDFYTDRSLSSFDEKGSRLTEHVDPFTGNLFVEFQSIRIPGSGGLDIVLRHFYTNHQNGNGEQPKMSVGGVGWNIHFGRVLSKREDMCISIPTTPSKYPVIETSDGKRQILYPATNNSFEFITTDRWRVECISSSGGFLVYSPDGIRYTMDMKNTDSIEGVHSWYTTSIKDRNNNELTIQYTGSDRQFRITKIRSSDFREVNFAYLGTNGGILRLSSISASNRTWRFIYGEFSNSLGNYYLREIAPPTGNHWYFSYIDSANVQAKGNFSLMKITTPYGGTIEYTYGWQQFDPGFSLNTTVVSSRKTNDLKGNISNWYYNYDPAGDAYSTPSCSSTDYDKTTISTPKGMEYYYYYGASVATAGCIWRIGRLRRKQIGSYAEQYTWNAQLISNFPNGRPQRPDKQDTKAYAPILEKKVITLDGSGYTTDYSNYDSYGNPRRITETGTASRITTLTYYINTSKWIINQISDETVSGIGTIDRTYNSNGNLSSVSEYGLTTNYTYYSGGDLKTLTNPRNKRTTYGNYYRGIPGRIQQPDGAVLNSTVNYYGDIASRTDGEGNTTSYSYDLLGRLTGIVYPQYRNRTLSWEIRKKTERVGGYSKTTYFDGFGKEVSVVEAGSNPSVSIETEYDAVGEVRFRSYPGASSGDSYLHDQIGRVSRIAHADGTARTYEYLSGNRVKVTNERGYVTTYSYRSYGNPVGERYLTYIDVPGGMDTSIGRNAIGQITSVTQNGNTRTYNYYGNRTLKSIVDPETGTTLFGRDGNGNMTSRKVGASATTNYTYDGMDRLTYIDYPSGTPDIDIDHDLNGNMILLNNGVSSWSYTYDKRNNIKSESLSIDGKNFSINYGYSDVGYINTIYYPSSSGRTIVYAPDNLGRATKAGPYVSSATHWASGPIRHQSLSNGRYLDTLLNDRRWIDRIKVNGSGGGGNIDYSYTYDGMGNIDITNNLAPSMSVYNTYDGVDRLINSNSSGNWGSGVISYSNDGDILTYQLGGDKLSYTYSGTNNYLINIKRNNAPYMLISYDAYGNIVSDGVHTYHYNDAGDLVSADNNIVNEYDGNHNRVTRIKEGILTYFMYAKSGNLIGEYSASGKWITENVYLDGKLAAQVDNMPGQPRTLTVPSQSTIGEYSVSWGAVTHDAPEFFELYESSSSDFRSSILVYRGIGRNVDITSRDDGAYYYRVRGCNSLDICSEYTTADNHVLVRHTPSVPSAITYPASSTTGGYSVEWSDSAGTVTHYELEEATHSTFSDAHQIYSGLSLDYAVNSQVSGDYYYRVRACNDYACSNYRKRTAKIKVRIPPGTPTSISYPGVTTTGYFKVNWEAPSGIVTHYEVEQAHDATFTDAHRVYRGTALMKYITLLELGSYYYRVRACNDFACSAYQEGGLLIFMDDPSLIFKDGFE